MCHVSILQHHICVKSAVIVWENVLTFSFLPFFFLTITFCLTPCGAAWSPVWVPSHPAKHTSVTIPLLCGWYEANTHSRHLHRPAHLEHSALHTAVDWLTSQTEPGAGHPACEFKVWTSHAWTMQRKSTSTQQPLICSFTSPLNVASSINSVCVCVFSVCCAVKLVRVWLHAVRAVTY